MYTDAARSPREFRLSKPADIEHPCTIALVTDGLKQTLSTPDITFTRLIIVDIVKCKP